MLSRLATRYTVRPARLEDVEAVCDLCNAWSISLRGVDTYDADELRLDWQSPGFNLETDTQLVHADGKLVGYTSVWDTDEPHVRVFGLLRVHPDCRDAALEGALLEWMETRARLAIERAPTDARVVLATTVWSEDDARADRLGQRGYNLVRHFVRLRIEQDALPPAAEIPEGMVIRPFEREADFRPMVVAVREAFRDHWGHVESDLEEELAQWRHWIDEDPSFDPSVWHLACAGDEIVGVSLGTTKRPESPDLAYIHVLCVTRPWRGRGVARALLHHSFRVFHQRERSVVDLDADAANLTGAMRLYEGVGMKQIWRNDAYELELRPGVDLSLQSLEG